MKRRGVPCGGLLFFYYLFCLYAKVREIGKTGRWALLLISDVLLQYQFHGAMVASEDFGVD